MSENYALEALLVALTALVRCDAHERKHLTNTRDDTLNGDIVADLLRIHLSDRVGVEISTVGRGKHDIVATGHLMFQITRLVGLVYFSLLSLCSLFTMTLQ